MFCQTSNSLQRRTGLQSLDLKFRRFILISIIFAATDVVICQGNEFLCRLLIIILPHLFQETKKKKKPVEIAK